MDKIKEGDVFTLTDENDDEQDVEVLGSIELEGTQYVAVALVEELTKDTEEDVDVFFLKVEENGELSAIDDDEEFDRVSTVFDEMMDEEEE